MSTLTKKKAAPRKVSHRAATSAGIMGLSPVRKPPETVGTIGDVLKMGANFGKGADWDLIAKAHEAREI